MERDPDILVDLTTASSEFEAGVIVEALKGQGIAAHVKLTKGERSRLAELAADLL